MFNNEKLLSTIAKILLVVFIAVVSIFICSKNVPNLPFFKQAGVTIDETKDTVTKFSAAMLTTSVAITLLPDDFATPLAETLADLTKYCVLILGMIYFEKIMLGAGISLTFTYIVPLACILFAIYFITNMEVFKTLAKKIIVLAIALIFVVPCGTYASNFICADTLANVETATENANVMDDKINDMSKDFQSDGGLLDRVTNALQNVLNKGNEVVTGFKKVVNDCIYSVAILIVTSFVIPLVTFLLFIWILNQLFKFQSVEVITSKIVKNVDAKNEREEVE